MGIQVMTMIRTIQSCTRDSKGKLPAPVVRPMTAEEEAEFHTSALANHLATPLEPWRFHAMLEVNNLTTAARGAITGMTGRAGVVATQRFERANEFHRSDALVTTLAATLGISDADLDAMWVEALTM